MYIKIKRGIDLILALGLLIIFGIPMCIIAICIKLEDGGQVIYKSKRMGKGLKEFNVYKFRSMTTKREELHSDLSHEQMVTKVGRVIRKTSLDELPQLFNILKGEMSFIGPGISGLAQVRGRNGINIFKKIEYDIKYVDNISFKEDVKLVFETIKTVFSKVNAEISEQGIKKEIHDLQVQNVKTEDIKYKEVV